MIPLIAEKQTEIARLCDRFHVRRLDVFGSAARGEIDPKRSDLDFLVELSLDGSDRALDVYFGLKEGLEELFGRPVDLVMSDEVANPYVRAEMDRDRLPVYAP